MTPLPLSNPQDIRDTVRQGYGQIALSQRSSCCSSASCSGTADAGTPDQLARAIGYNAEDLSQLPEGANMGLSCGNPVALAELRPGEVVADLGSGGGFDVFIAGRRVGPAGRAIGVDMTPEMLSKARRNLSEYQKLTGLENVEFRLGEIEHLPLADNSVDAVISNCVINLSPDKPQVWREIARVLRPGGRVSVADPALLQPLPDAVAQQAEALVGCVAGAVLVDETRRMIEAAGLVDIRLEGRSQWVDAITDENDPVQQTIAKHLPTGCTSKDYLTSLFISARKP